MRRSVLPRGLSRRSLGLPPHAMIGVVFTLLIAALQAAVGLWLGCAVMGISSSR